MPERIDTATLRRFVLQTFGRARRTQDSPVTPDTWMRYLRVAEDTARARIAGAPLPDPEVDLLITPTTGSAPGAIAKAICDSLTAEQRVRARIALSSSRVVASLAFPSLVRKVVPLSDWWKSRDVRFKETRDAVSYLTENTGEDELISAVLVRFGASVEFFRYAALVGFVQKLMDAQSVGDIELLAGLARKLGPVVATDDEDEPGLLEGQRRPGEPEARVVEVFPLVHGYELAMDGVIAAWRDPSRRARLSERDASEVFLVSLNRPAAQTLFDSRRTVKADAAHRVFDISARGISAAVVDNGIDARHPAFRDRSAAEARVREQPGDAPWQPTRVLATYDFSLLRDLVSCASYGGPDIAEPAASLLRTAPNAGMALDHLRTRGDNARDLDWSIVGPLIQVPHTAALYRPPAADHGTHVAGILAADLQDPADLNEPLRGICPDLTLYDLRVFDVDGRGDEFAILCAIEFAGWLNRARENPLVHVVNLSLALRHEVDAFACGRTPVCDACNRLVGAGTVVVAAAGNTGFEATAGRVSIGNGYRPISITDPGNAEAVITVGSTHRRDPHAYGVSYFSGRGPTGDGRRKPDLLAPGEKITSTIRDGQSARMDGTSMAAPHVSGAAALLMARYPELVGQPQRIKEILKATATDLGREPQFQGAGLLDVLRALQAV